MPEEALIDMGDFAGGTLKYIRRHPVDRLTIAGGFAKLCKLGAGLLDLHSKRGSVDLDWLAERISDAGGDAQPELVTAPPAVGPSDGREDTAVPRPVESPSNPWEQSSASGGAKAWDQNPASSESAWNQDKKPWWKFW